MVSIIKYQQIFLGDNLPNASNHMKINHCAENTYRRCKDYCMAGLNFLVISNLVKIMWLLVFNEAVES